MEVGETVDKNEEYEIEYAQAPVGDNLMALQLVPMDIEEEVLPTMMQGCRNGWKERWRV